MSGRPFVLSLVSAAIGVRDLAICECCIEGTGLHELLIRRCVNDIDIRKVFPATTRIHVCMIMDCARKVRYGGGLLFHAPRLIDLAEEMHESQEPGDIDTFQD